MNDGWARATGWLPVRPRHAGPRSLTAPAAPPGAVIRTDSVGFLGATEQDQARWLAGFRHLLDGLDSPLQVVMAFRPGKGDGAAVEEPGASRRALDLAFANQLGCSPQAQSRSVVLVVQPPSASAVAQALRSSGLPTGRAPAPEAAVPEGMEYGDRWVDDEGHHRTWYLHRFPGVELEPGWLLGLVPPRLQITISWHAEPLPSAWIVAYLQRQLAQMRARRLDQETAAHADPMLAGALPQAADLQRRIAASEERGFHLSLYLTLTTATQEGLAEGARAIEAAARACLCQLYPCSLRMAAGRLATLPLGRDPLHRHRLLDTSSVVTLFPWLDADLREPGGLVVGRSRTTRCPVLLDPFDDSLRVNGNIGVFGHSGAGKTYLLSALAMGMLACGGQVFVIDPEREYGALARGLGGTEVNLALGTGQALNVLERRPWPENEGLSETWLGPAVADALDLVAVISGGLDEPERAVVEAAIRQTYRDREEPLLADVVARMPPDARPTRILSRWVTGSLGAMFSSPTNVDLDAPIVAFAMRELREELVAPVHFLLAEALWTRIKAQRRRRMLVVDELGLLFEDPIIRRFVVNLARRLRKYEGGLVFATQNPGDLLATDAGAVVATNPAVHFFGAQRPGEAAKLQRAFDLSDPQRTALETARRGEFLLVAGHERLMVEVMAPPWQERAMQQARPHRRPAGPEI